MAGARKYHVDKARRSHEIQKRREERAQKRAYAAQRHGASYLADDETLNSWKIKLNKLGLEIRDMPADGNCLFRALGDQMDGHSQNHTRHRAAVCNYMVDHKEEFSPFVVDDVSFDKHINNLRQVGTFAGNDALVAFARMHNVSIVIHQLDSAALQIHGSDRAERELHLAYHNGEHYSSVRRIADRTSNPAYIKLRVQQESNFYASDENGEVRITRTLDDVIRTIMTSTGCQDTVLIQDAWEQCNCDVSLTEDYVRSLLIATDTASLSSHVSSESTVSSQPSSSIINHDQMNTGAGKSKASIKNLTKAEKKREKKKRAEERHRLKTANELVDINHNDQSDRLVYEITTNMTMLSV